MAMQSPKSGPNDVGSYQLSGIPWVTGSTLPATSIVHYSFPGVTKFFVVRNTGAAGTSVAVGFSENGLKSQFRNYFTLTSGQELSLELRVKDLYLSATQGPSATVEVIAGMTPIMYRDFPVLTGSNSGSFFSGIG
jgi:hypothetical protein